MLQLQVLIYWICFFAVHNMVENEQERLNPENGICLSALYDKAFDKGLIGINEALWDYFICENKIKTKGRLFSKTFFSLKR